MKVKLLKDHLDHKKGETIEVDEDRAKYWEMVGVAEATTKTPAKKEAPKKTAAKKTSKK